MVKQKRLRTSWLVILAVFFMLNGCGGGGGGSSSDGISDVAGTAGVAVDPYIKGAIFEEVSAEGAVLQTSLQSDVNGRFKFNKKVKAGSVIRMKEGSEGSHGGKPYDGSLKGTTDDGGVMIVSPLTTLLANGFTPEQVIALMENAGISGLQESDLYSDPMAGLAGLETFDDDDLIQLQASIAVNNFLLRLNNFSWGPGDAGDVAHLTETAEMVKFCLNWNRFQAVRDQLNSTLADFATPLTVDHLINASSNLVETLTLSARNGDISDPVAETEGLVDSLGELALHYYVQENRGDAAIEEAIDYDILPAIADNQYPQTDLAGGITVHVEDGTVASSDNSEPTDPVSGTYPAAILQTVEENGSNFVLNWSLPGGTSEVPSGGYDIIIDGTDTGSEWRTTQTSTVISGLEAGVEHSFQIQTRWLQAEPDLVPVSNELFGVIASTVEDTPTEPNLTEPNPDAVEPPSSTDSGAVKVFPGAVGFGTETAAGRGGQIIKVTNLNDSGSGSLRAAIDASGARTIVFEVGGAINLSSDLRISNGSVTIAGQTAPFPGIMLKGYGMRISTSHVLLQHLAIRVGDDGRSADGSSDNADALQITGSGSSNIVIDHCSWSWGIDENSSTWASNAHDITFSNNIIGEALVSSVHTEGAHSKGLLIGGSSNNPKRVAIIGNLFAHNVDRNPQLKGGTSTVISNNIMYNCGDSYSISNMTRNYVTEKTLASYMGNIFVDGPQSASGAYAIKAESNLASGSAFYANDNVNLSRPSYLIKDSAGCKVSSAPLSIADFSPLSSGSVVDSVLIYTGTRPAQRDAVDARLVVEVVNGTGSRKNHSSGLWPTYPQANRDFDQFIPASPNGDDDGDGYTNIEEVLYAMALQVEGR